MSSNFKHQAFMTVINEFLKKNFLSNNSPRIIYIEKINMHNNKNINSIIIYPKYGISKTIALHWLSFPTTLSSWGKYS